MKRAYEGCRTYLSRTHEVRKTLSTFWYDIFHNLAQVPCDEVDVVRRMRLVWIAADGPGMRLCQ